MPDVWDRQLDSLYRVMGSDALWTPQTGAPETVRLRPAHAGEDVGTRFGEEPNAVAAAVTVQARLSELQANGFAAVSALSRLVEPLIEGAKVKYMGADRAVQRWRFYDNRKREVILDLV